MDDKEMTHSSVTISGGQESERKQTRQSQTWKILYSDDLVFKNLCCYCR